MTVFPFYIAAEVVIIDAPAPSDDSAIIRPFNNTIYGVKLSSDNKYLYVYDGVKNGLASDPIALTYTPVAENSSTPSSSGCSTYNFSSILLALVLLFAPMLGKVKR